MVLPVKKRIAQYYKTHDGLEPCKEWIENLNDTTAKRKFFTRIERAEDGNFGQSPQQHRERIKDVVSEIKIDHGPGYRLYYALDDNDSIILLLAAGTKKKQQADIDTAGKTINKGQVKMSSFEEHLIKELKDPQMAVEYIIEALEEPGDSFSYLMKALGKVAKAHGLSALVESSGLGKSSIRNMIQEDSNPTLKNAVKLLSAMGMQISVKVKNEVEPKPANALDVADYIIKNYGHAKAETTFWIQKILYYAQAESLKNFDIPLFYQPVEAWKNGPVVRDLWVQHRGSRYLSSYSGFGDENNLSHKQKLSIDWALEKYGSATGEVLSQLTHAQDPWKNARGSTPDGEYCDTTISNEAIKEFYKSIPHYDDEDDD